MAEQAGKGTPFTTGQTNTQGNSDRQAAYFAYAKERAGFKDSVEEGADYGTGIEQLTPNLKTEYVHPDEKEMAPDGDSRRGAISKPQSKTAYPGKGW